MVNVVMPAGIFLVGLCALLFVFSLFAGIFNDLGSSRKLLIGIGVLIVLFFICFAMASDYNPTNLDLNPSTVKFITAGILLMIVLTIIAFVSWIGTAIYDAIK